MKKKAVLVMMIVAMIGMCVFLSGCGSSGYEKITTTDGEVEEYNVGGFLKAVEKINNELYVEEHYDGGDVEVLAPVEEIESNIYNTNEGYEYKYRIELKGGWVVDASNMDPDELADIAKGDMVKVTGTGNLYIDAFDYLHINSTRRGYPEDPVIEKYEE